MKSVYISLSTLMCMCLLVCLSKGYAEIYSEINHRLKQVHIYIGKGYFKQARKELDELYETPEGRTHSGILRAYAQVFYEESNLRQAIYFIDQARRYTQDDLEFQKLDDLYKEWSNGLVSVTFTDPENLPGQLKITRKHKLYNKKRKQAFLQSQMEMNKGISSPYETYLPFGTYELIHAQGKRRFTLSDQNQSVPMKLLHPFIRLEQEARLQSKETSQVSTWVYVGLGVLTVGALGFGIYSLTQPPTTFTFTF